MASILERFKSAASVFRNPEPAEQVDGIQEVYVSGSRGGYNTGYNSQASVVTKIYNQIAMDVASASIRHVRVNKDGFYEEDMNSYLNRCLTFRPNIDQTRRAFFQDLVWTMIEDGYLAVLPVDTTSPIYVSSSFDTRSMRVGRIVRWYPRHITVNAYNDLTGRRQEVTVPKENVAVITNPLYEVMNKPNSDLRRLTNKLNLIDRVDSQSASGKLDLIIQLPYEIRTSTRQDIAEKRRSDIEEQLQNSSLGIAYIGATEKVTQLNRAVTNNLLEQVDSLTKNVYNSLGLTEDVFNGTASPQTMTNYYNRTINPILDEITSALSWGLISQTGRSQGQTIKWFRSPFSLVPMEKFPEIASTLSTSEIATSNELRAELGWKPAVDSRADQLRNPNINVAGQELEDQKEQEDLTEIEDNET